MALRSSRPAPSTPLPPQLPPRRRRTQCKPPPFRTTAASKDAMPQCQPQLREPVAHRASSADPSTRERYGRTCTLEKLKPKCQRNVCEDVCVHADCILLFSCFDVLKDLSGTYGGLEQVHASFDDDQVFPRKTIEIRKVALNPLHVALRRWSLRPR